MTAPFFKQRIQVPERPCVADTCLPVAFVNSAIRTVSSTYDDDAGAEVGDGFFDTMLAATVVRDVQQPGRVERKLEKPESACKELPLDVFSLQELYGERPSELPEGFKCVPTPVEYGNMLVTRNMYGKPLKRPWHSNLWVLYMPGFTRPVIGRHLRLPNSPSRPNAHQWRLLEGIFFSYCIEFHMNMLDVEGVQFYPAFLPKTTDDVNYWARQSIDCTLAANTVPPTPSGWYIPFARLPKTQSITHVSDKKRGYVLTSAYGQEHPVIRGDRMFPPLDGPTDEKSIYQDGGIGFVVCRLNLKEAGVTQETARVHGSGSASASASGPPPAQTIMLYTRVAFSKDALASHDVQLSKINAAIQFALANGPTDKHGVPWVSIASTATAESACSENMYGTVFDVAPDNLRHVLENTTDINAVNVSRDVLTVLTRSIASTEHIDSYEDAHTEARFRVALAEKLLSADADAPDGETDVTVIMPVLVNSDAFSSLAGTVTDGDTSARYVHQERLYSAASFPHIVQQYNAAMDAVAARRSLCACSPILNDIAPPDAAAYDDKTVLILGFGIDVCVGATEKQLTRDDMRRYQRIAGDLATRFMWDMMMFDPSLAVVSTRSSTFLSLFTDKAPGLLCVKSTRDGVAVKKTNTSDSRKTRDPHPALLNFSVETVPYTPKALPCAPIPELTREEARTNPFLREMLHGPLRPTSVSGCLASMYRRGGANDTDVSGTAHAWPVYGALVNKNTMEPKTPKNPFGFFGPEVTEEQRLAGLRFLFAPLYNAAYNEIYKKDGRWSKEGSTRREWNKAYGMDLTFLHAALGWRLYPAFASEYADPRAVHIWELKKMVEAQLQFALRYGRVLRRLLSNHRRKIRCDYPIVIFRNYFYDTKKRFPDAPVQRMFVSALNAYQKNVILGEKPPQTHRKHKLSSGNTVAAACAAAKKKLTTTKTSYAVKCDGSDESDDEDEHDEAEHEHEHRTGDEDADVDIHNTRPCAAVPIFDGEDIDDVDDVDNSGGFVAGTAYDAMDPMAAMYGYNNDDYEEILTNDIVEAGYIGTGKSKRRASRRADDDDDDEDEDDDDDEEFDDDDGVDDVVDEKGIEDGFVLMPGTVAARMSQVQSVFQTYEGIGSRFQTTVSTFAMEPGSVLVRPSKRVKL